MTSLKKCAICETEFDALSRNFGRGRHRYCSAKCRQVADNRRHYRRRNPKKSVEELTRACVICGLTFVADVHRPNQLTCSVKCNEARMNAMRRRQSAERHDGSRRECAECGKGFLPNKFGTGKTKYCSIACRKVAINRKRAQLDTRPYNPRLLTAKWQHAKKIAVARDGGKCCLCGTEAKPPHVHHIFYRTEAEMNDHSPENLLTLCKSCHPKIHDIKLGRIDGQVVVSGAVLDLLGVSVLSVVKGD